MDQLIKKNAWRRAGMIALSYILVSGLYIWGSDYLLALMTSDVHVLATIGTYKGLAFVLLTGLVLFLLVRRMLIVSLEQRSLSELAFYDPLTRLPNAILFERRTRDWMRECRESGSELLIAVVGVDGLKRVNESLGARGGDAVLREIGRRLAAVTGDRARIARSSGDTFLLALANRETRELIAEVEQAQATQLRKPVRIGSEELPITVSIGIALFPEDDEDLHELIAAANSAMHRAKLRGGDTCIQYSREYRRRAAEYFSMERSLRRAVEREELYLQYQPQVDLQTDQIVGAEALLRWSSPELGEVSPGQFIPVAEQSGLIHAIGDWVMHAALAQLDEWQPHLPAEFRLAVNISAEQFSQRAFLVQLLRSLGQRANIAERLELEITESVLIRDPDYAADVLEQMRGAGLKVALDDFGTGYSSLSYLQRLPLDRLKIDQSFVRGIPQQRESTSIVRAIIGMASSLGIHQVAEGVETAAERDALRKFGCRYAQGYFYGRPMPAARLLESWQAEADAKQEGAGRHAQPYRPKRV